VVIAPDRDEAATVTLRSGEAVATVQVNAVPDLRVVRRWRLRWACGGARDFVSGDSHRSTMAGDSIAYDLVVDGASYQEGAFGSASYASPTWPSFRGAPRAWLRGNGTWVRWSGGTEVVEAGSSTVPVLAQKADTIRLRSPNGLAEGVAVLVRQRAMPRLFVGEAGADRHGNAIMCGWPYMRGGTVTLEESPG
jgi:hypothetical protein